MFHLTQQERQVFLFIGLVIFIGLGLDLSLKGRWDRIKILHILDDPSFFPRINVNKASFEDLVALPRMNRALARAIIDHRMAHGPFRTLVDLQKVQGIKVWQWKKIVQYLKVD